MGENIILYIAIALIVVCFIVALIAGVKTGYFKRLKPIVVKVLSSLIKTYCKPVIKEAIIQVEIFCKDNNLEKAGVAKMTGVVNSLKNYLPKFVNQILTDEIIEGICQSVYDLIQDQLLELCEKAKNRSLKQQ